MKRVMEDLRKRRKALGLSQMELARLVGVSLLTIQTWERSVSEPKPENREKLEQVLAELEKRKAT
jgi:transcriptional regulator with XRE-family HTH domain